MAKKTPTAPAPEVEQEDPAPIVQEAAPETPAPGSDINPEAQYDVTLRRPIKLGRGGTYARPGLPLTMSGARLLENLDNIDAYTEVAG